MTRTSGENPTESNEYLFSPHRVGPDQRELGDYRLLHELGSGGMATLYLATDVEGRLVAVKRLHAHLARDAAFVAMFRDEAAIASRLSHPHIAQVLRLEEHEGELFIAMEYVHGESLAAFAAELVKRGARLPLPATLHLLGQACLGLHAAHEQRDEHGAALEIVHRDLSPHNLLLTYDGELKIVDFGVAAAAGKLHHTETGMIKGKLAYLSPEQARGEKVDRRSDVYALGLVLYELLSGQRCLRGDNPVALLAAAQGAHYRPMEELGGDFPAALEVIVARALAPRREARYRDAAELYAALYEQLSRSGGMTSAALGELLRRTFPRRYALREELRSLAFRAPEVLQEEELELELAVVNPGHRCEHCGHVAQSAAGLAEHSQGCSQRKWWEHNFGNYDAAGDARATREAIAATNQPRAGLWQRLKSRLGSPRQDPLTARLQSAEARLAGLRDRRTADLTRQGMVVLWQLVGEIARDGERPSGLLARIKPRITRCADALLTLALEADATAGYRAALARFDTNAELEALEERHRQASSAELREALGRTLTRKRALASEQRAIADKQQLLSLRLEAMVDVLGVTLAKVARITAHTAVADGQADTQITVFIDSLVLELGRLGDSLRELDEELKRP